MTQGLSFLAAVGLAVVTLFFVSASFGWKIVVLVYAFGWILASLAYGDGPDGKGSPMLFLIHWIIELFPTTVLALLWCSLVHDWLSNRRRKLQ